MGGRILVVDDSSTIRKVVSGILERSGFTPVDARDGQHALERLKEEGEFELILLDFVMPRMNGYQFCRRLRAEPEHKNLPVVLMSAKGDRIRGQFVQQTGAIDAITKPFDARGLIAVVEGAIQKARTGTARPVPDAASMLDEADVVESLRPSSVSWNPDVNRLRAASSFAEAIAGLMKPSLFSLAKLDEAAYQLAFQRVLSPEAVEQVLPVVDSLGGGSGGAALSGDVAIISIAEILQLLSFQRHSGVLTVRAPKGASIILHIKEGLLGLATSAGLDGEFGLGRYLVQEGSLKEPQLAEVLKSQAEEREHSAQAAEAEPLQMLLGQRLISQGIINEQQLRAGLVRQANELIYEVVRWSAGRFDFELGELSAPAQAADLSIPTGAIVMEGFRRVDEWRLIEGSFDFENVLFHDPKAPERIAKQSKLTKLESTVWEAIDGSRTVREIVASAPASSFDVCKILYQFVNSRLARIES